MYGGNPRHMGRTSNQKRPRLDHDADSSVTGTSLQDAARTMSNNRPLEADEMSSTSIRSLSSIRSGKEQYATPFASNERGSSGTKYASEESWKVGYGKDGMNRFPSWYSGGTNDSKFLQKFSRHREQFGGTPGRGTNPTTGRSSTGHHRTSGSIGRSKKRPKSSDRYSTGGENNDGGGPYVVCAINENNAKETSVVSFDLDAPVAVQVAKLSNGQSYSETLAYMRVLQPALVLYNEENIRSHLARQLLEHFHPDYYQPDGSVNPTAAAAAAAQSDPGYMLNAFHPSFAPPADICKVKFIHRRFFRQTEASLLLERLARKDTYDATLKGEYTITSSFHALIKYSQQNLNLDHDFVEHSLDVQVNSGEDGKRMDIDKSTLMALEILTNAFTGKSKGQPCLISTMDCTKTSVGSRLLRSTLMAPPCRLGTIDARLELVEEFVVHDVLFEEVDVCLKTLPPLDKMLAGIALKPKNRRSLPQMNADSNGGDSGSDTGGIADYLKLVNKDGAGVSIGQANKEISALVSIKHTLAKLPALAQALEKNLNLLPESSRLDGGVGDAGNGSGCGDSVGDHDGGRIDTNAALRVGLGMDDKYGTANHNDEENSTARKPIDASQQLLRAIHSALSQPALGEILRVIEDSFVHSTAYRMNSLDQKFQVCFALKSTGKTFLDVHRHQLKWNVDEIYRKAEELTEKYQTRVIVKYTAARGWHLKLSKDMKDNLPDEFIYPAASANSICCTTEDVYSLSNRANENIVALLYLTLDLVQDLLDVARSHYSVLARVSDAVALLDLCHSFADKITLAADNQPWTRPVFGEPSDEGSDLVIKNGRFVIDIDDSILSQCGPGSMIPNDTNAPASKPLTVITGINGSGKTTYMKQIALIVLLAHCGCYVPAEVAQIPVSSDVANLTTG
jgi:DNA mismatch repair ATPase MutS